MRQYWHNLITEKSFQLLKELNRSYKFILIGGWAIFLYTQALKSKDIDIVLDYKELSRLKEKFEIIKNSRLKKYEVKKEGVDIDIYLPYFSNPGLPAEDLKNFVVSKEGFQVPWPEILLILKQKVFLERRNTPKGSKDKLDIFSLLMLPELDWQRYKKILRKYQLTNLLSELKNLLEETFELKELGLSRHKMAKFKKEVLKKLSG